MIDADSHPPTDPTDADEPADRPDHLADVPDGCGCVEVWEHLSDDRAD